MMNTIGDYNDEEDGGGGIRQSPNEAIERWRQSHATTTNSTNNTNSKKQQHQLQISWLKQQQHQVKY